MLRYDVSYCGGFLLDLLKLLLNLLLDARLHFVLLQFHLALMHLVDEGRIVWSSRVILIISVLVQ